MATILIVGGDGETHAPVRRALEEAGFAVEAAPGGAVGEARAVAAGPALVVLEAGPAGGEGDEAVRRVRSATDVPLILVTRGSGQADRARGLEQGADDCLSAPVNPRELAARAKAILRRAPAANPTARLLVVGDLTLDLAGRTATVAGRELALRAREFDLLAALAREPGVVLSRGRLLEEVWELAGDIKTRTLDVHAQRLREQLAGSGLAIETVRGIGLKLVAADR